MRMNYIGTLLATALLATSLAACSPHKKVPSPVVVTPQAQVQVVKPTLESLDARLKVVEARNHRLDARAAAKARVAQ